MSTVYKGPVEGLQYIAYLWKVYFQLKVEDGYTSLLSIKAVWNATFSQKPLKALSIRRGFVENLLFTVYL